MAGVEYQVTKVDPTDPETKGMVYQVHKVSEEVAATLGGKVYRARIVKVPDDPEVSGKVYQIVLIGDPTDPAVKGKVYNAILTGDSEVVVVGPGVSPLDLPDAIADSLSYVKAFGGTEQRDIPDNYLQRQFIYMMDGSYLLTDIVPTYDCKIEMDFQITNLPTVACTFLGGRAAGSPSGFIFAKSGDGNFAVDAFGGTRYNSGVTPTVNTRYKFIYDNQTATLTSGGSTLFTNTFTGTDATGAALCIDAVNNNGTVVPTQLGTYLYSFRMWNGQGELVANYVPAVQKGTVPVVGFYDMVTGTFKTATAGTFAAGGEAVPTPDYPMDIVCNNGVLKAYVSATGTVTQSPVPAPTAPVYPVFYKQGDMSLCAVDNYSGNTAYDSYDASTSKITRRVGVIVLDGTEDWEFSNGAGRLKISDAKYAEPVSTYCSHYPRSSALSVINVEDKHFTVYQSTAGSGGYEVLIVKDSSFTSGEQLKTWLSDQYTAGTPVTVWYILDTPVEESWTGGEIYADGTQETIGIHSANNKNLFNGAFEQGGFFQGVKVSTTTRIRTPNPISLAAGTYTISCASAYEIWVEINNVTAASWASSKTITVSATDQIMIAVRNKADPNTAPVTPDEPVNVQIEAGPTATTYSPYYDGGLAICENLFAIQTLKDEQEMLSGSVTRNIGVKVLDGTENWICNDGIAVADILPASVDLNEKCMCSHYVGVTANVPNASMPDKSIKCGTSSFRSRVVIKDASFSSATDVTTFLAAQYAAGTPVIVLYALETADTESVTGQTLQVQAGDNTLEITQASLNGLELEAKYEKEGA